MLNDQSPKVRSSLGDTTPAKGYDGEEGGLDSGYSRSSTTRTSEDEPLLRNDAEDNGDGAPQTVIPTWYGELDFEGLPWWRKPSIIWLLVPFSISVVAVGGVLVPKLNLVVSLVCREYLAEQASLNPAFTFAPVIPLGENPQCDTPEISARATAFALYANLVAGILSAVSSPKLGSLSDRYGRIIVLVGTTFGGLLSETVTIFAAKYPDVVNYRWLLFGAVFEGLCGSFIAGMAISHSYATDCTPPAKRAVAFGYFHACLFAGIAIGPVWAALVVRQTGSILTIFYVVLIVHVLYLLLLFFVVPESLAKKRQLAAREKYARAQNIIKMQNAEGNGTVWSRIQFLNLLEPLKILYPRGVGSSPQLRRNLLLLSAVDTIIFGVAMGSMTVILIYSKLMFHWDTADQSIFIAILNTCRVGALLTLLPGLNYIFRTRYRNKVRRESGIDLVERQSGSDQLDLYTIRVALVFEVCAFVGFSLAPNGNAFTAVGVMASVGGIGSPTVQSALTKHVPHDRVGQLLGATGLLHALARIVFPIFCSAIFIGTAKVLPQSVFMVLAGSFVLAFICSWGVRPHIYLDDDGVAPTHSEESAESEERDAERIVDEEITNI